MMDAFERRRHVTSKFLGRVSSNAYDAGYANHCNLVASGYKVTVFLNGIEQVYCLSADPDSGEVCRYVTMKGAVVGAYQTEVVKGEVVVRIEREMAA